MGYSISNNIIPYLHVYKSEKDNKPVIMFLGRQHPA